MHAERLAEPALARRVGQQARRAGAVRSPLPVLSAYRRAVAGNQALRAPMSPTFAAADIP